MSIICAAARVFAVVLLVGLFGCKDSRFLDVTLGDRDENTDRSDYTDNSTDNSTTTETETQTDNSTHSSTNGGGR